MCFEIHDAMLLLSLYFSASLVEQDENCSKEILEREEYSFPHSSLEFSSKYLKRGYAFSVKPLSNLSNIHYLVHNCDVRNCEL